MRSPLREKAFRRRVLLSIKKFEGLLETLEILADDKAMKSIRKSMKEAQQGKWVDFDEVFGE